MHRGGGVEATQNITILGLLIDLAIAIGAMSRQRNTLANLNQCRIALAGLDLLNATVPAVGTATNDADLVSASDLAAARFELQVASACRSVYPIPPAVLLAESWVSTLINRRLGLHPVGRPPGAAHGSARPVR